MTAELDPLDLEFTRSTDGPFVPSTIQFERNEASRPATSTICATTYFSSPAPGAPGCRARGANSLRISGWRVREMN
jgi:hypothetical protein